MGNKKIQFPYLHGFSTTEQERLKKQAHFTEHLIFRDIDFSAVNSLIEIGCGVGAQSEILLRRYPDLHLTGIDTNEKQLATATQILTKLEFANDRFVLHKMDAENLSFESAAFDAAFLCWLLEHVPDPARVLSEARRVLKPGATIIINEVMNSSFFLDPYSPNVWKYWMAYNDYQYDHAGDPFIGAKLGNFLLSQGYRDINTRIKTLHFDNRQPQKRKATILFWEELLLSAADQLCDANYVDNELVEKTKEEFDQVSNDPNAVFFYSFMQAEAKVFLNKS